MADDVGVGEDPLVRSVQVWLIWPSKDLARRRLQFSNLTFGNSGSRTERSLMFITDLPQSVLRDRKFPQFRLVRAKTAPESLDGCKQYTLLIISCMLDVTQRERQEAKSRLHAHFTAIIAHSSEGLNKARGRCPSDRTGRGSCGLELPVQMPTSVVLPAVITGIPVSRTS
ncbi:hypothetical protein J6590_093388 [Homalodisca vitripennis]|nr:hypothetical protein J6590_093388 [Homalodisca vitripennis]